MRSDSELDWNWLCSVSGDHFTPNLPQSFVGFDVTEDESGLSWRSKFDGFMDYLLDCCSSSERVVNLEAAARTQTGGIRVEAGDEDADGDGSTGGVTTLANVQVATGTTRRAARSRLMRAFNTPFFPDILVCTQVMGEGVETSG